MDVISRPHSAPASPISTSKLAFASSAVGTASALGYVFARPLQAKETVPCTINNCVYIQEQQQQQQQQQQRAQSPSPYHHPHHTQTCHVHKRFRLFRQKNKCPVHGSSRPNFILPQATVHPLVVHPDKILPDPPTPPPRSSSLSTFRRSAPSTTMAPNSSRNNTPIPPTATGALPLPGRLLTKHSNRTEHSFLGLSSSFSSSRLSSFSTCSSTSSYSTSATVTTPASTPSSSFAQASDIESFMQEHQHRNNSKKHNKSHLSNSHVYQPTPIHAQPTPPLLKCTCDRRPNRSPSPDTRQGGAASPRSPPIAPPSAQSRLRRMWRDSTLFQWPRHSTTSPTKANKPMKGTTCDTTDDASDASTLVPLQSSPSRGNTPYASSSLPATTPKIIASSSSPFAQQQQQHRNPVRRPYPAHTYDRNASPYVSDEGNHSISEHEEEDEDVDDDDDDDEDRFALGRTAHHHHRLHGASFQDEGADADEDTGHVLRSFPEGERLESELNRCSPEPPSPLPSSRKPMEEEDEEDDEFEDWDIQSDAGAPSSSLMYSAEAAQPTNFSAVTLPISSGYQNHHHHHCPHQKGPSNGSIRSRQRCVSLPADHTHNCQHGSADTRGRFRLPSLPSESWDDFFEIGAEDINVPTQVVETQISLQMDIHNIKNFASQIEDLKTLRASLRTASHSLRAKNPNKHQHLSTLFQRDWEQAEVIIDLGEIAQTQTQTPPASPSHVVPGPRTKSRAPSRRPSKKRLVNNNNNNNHHHHYHQESPSPAHATVAPASSAVLSTSPRESAWKRLSRIATGSSTKFARGSDNATVPVTSVESSTTTTQRSLSEHLNPAESGANPALATPSDVYSDRQGSSSSDAAVVVTNSDHQTVDAMEDDGRYEEEEEDEEEEDDDEDDDDDLIDDGYESFSCYSYSFVDGPITGVVSPIPTDRHMQVLKDILVEGLGHEVAQKFVIKHGEQDHVKFSVEVIPGLLNHLKGLHRRLSEQLREFQCCEEEEEQKAQQQNPTQEEASQQEIDRNQRPDRASMGDSMRNRLHQHRRRSMRPPLDLDFGESSSAFSVVGHTLKEVENEADAAIEPVAV
ncbi:hypothetical protein BGW42_002491 [Actinomortierella wolfii]|nr:hypothetical protein BGW42_002491 [Actinomortierella wolfii]